MDFSLLQIPDIPVVLGPWGALMLSVLVVLQGISGVYQWRRSTAVNILKEEVSAQKGKITRLEDDGKKLEERCRRTEEREEECNRKLDRLTALYLESRGQEEDDRKRERERESERR